MPGHMGSATSHRQSPSEPDATAASSEDEEELDHGIQVDVKSPKELVFVMVSSLLTYVGVISLIDFAPVAHLVVVGLRKCKHYYKGFGFGSRNSMFYVLLPVSN